MGIENLKYLVELSGGAKSYDLCKREKISQTMHEFADKKLKDRTGKVIKNKKQAIAIALSQTDVICKYNPNEKSQLIGKVNRDLNDKTKELILSNVIETLKAIEILQAKGKSNQVYIFKKLLFDKIINSQLDGISLNKNIWEEIKKINKLA